MTENSRYWTVIIQSRWFKLTAVAFMYAAVFIIAIQIGQLWLQRDVAIGKAPAIDSFDLDGEFVSLADYRGKPVLVYFWGSWCPICRYEHDTITDLSMDYQVIGVALQSGNVKQVQKHMEEQDADYTVVNDPDGEIGSRYGIRGVPASFIIDSGGNIRSVLTGYTTSLSFRYRLWALLPNK